LRDYELLIVPAVGVAVTIIFASVVDTFLVPLSSVAWPLIIVAVVTDVAVLFGQTRSRPQFPSSGREVAIPVFMALGSFGLGVAPLVHYGFATVIGDNWDPEIYLPLADLVARYRIGNAIPITANPVIPVLNGPIVRAEGGWGFSHVQALVDVTTSLPPHVTFAVILAFLTSLHILGSWALFRSLGLKISTAGLALVLLTFNGLILWSVYFGFAAQAMALALLPAFLAVTLLALDDMQWASGLLAAVLLAGLFLSYYRAIAPLLLLPMLLIFARRVVTRRATGRLLQQGALIGSGGLILSPVAQLRLFEAIPSLRTSDPSVGPGIREFVSPAVALGLAPFPADIQGLGGLLFQASFVRPAENVTIIVAGAFVAFGIYRKFGSDIGTITIGYVFFDLFMIFVAHYPYGYLKALSLMAFVPAILIAVGVGETIASFNRIRPFARNLGLLGGAALVLLIILNGSMVTRHYLLGRPGLYSEPVTELSDLRSVIPRGSPVYVSNSPELQGPTMGFIADALIDDEIYGNVHTGYSTYSRECPCALTNFALYPNDEVPGPPYSNYQQVWQNEAFKLLRRPPGLVYAFQDPAGTMLRDGTNYSVLLRGAVDSNAATPDRNTLSGPYSVTVRLSGLGPARLSATIGGSTQSVDLRTGETIDLSLGLANLPNVLILKLDAPGVVIVRDVLVWQPGQVVQTAEIPSNAVVVSTKA
jgi:hypothetical protein